MAETPDDAIIRFVLLNKIHQLIVGNDFFVLILIHGDTELVVVIGFANVRLMIFNKINAIAARLPSVALHASPDQESRFVV